MSRLPNIRVCQNMPAHLPCCTCCACYPPAVHAAQVQFSLLDRRPLNGMVQYCAPKGIKLLTYGSLAGGLLSDRYVEEPKAGLFGESCMRKQACVVSHG